MAIREQLETHGNWLFQRRSYLPVALLIPLALGMWELEPYRSEFAHRAWEVFCLTISVLGLAIRCKTVGHTPAYTSGRNTFGQLAVTMNTTGMYSIVRHPLYLGNLLIWLGISMFSMTWWVVCIFVLSFWVYYERIMLAEEEFLRRQFGSVFDLWAKQTPAIVPNPRKWVHPELPFSLRNVLKREYTAMFAIVVGFVTLELVEQAVTQQRFFLGPFYVAFGIVGMLAFVLLRTLKRKTRILHVEGR